MSENRDLLDVTNWKRAQGGLSTFTADQWEEYHRTIHRITRERGVELSPKQVALLAVFDHSPHELDELMSDDAYVGWLRSQEI